MRELIETSVHKEVKKGLWSVDELCQCLKIKKSTAYALAQSGSIPFYRVGRLIRFKPDDIQVWVEGCRSDNISRDKSAKRILEAKEKPMDVDTLVKKSIAEVKGNRYTSFYRETRPIKDLRKEVSYGTL
jgi:excisionase family DNA binding protein